jgi:hypothetical protein
VQGLTLAIDSNNANLQYKVIPINKYKSLYTNNTLILDQVPSLLSQVPSFNS